MEASIGFNNLENSDLCIDEMYHGGSSGDVGDDPISQLLGVGNMGGFRPLGSLATDNIRLLVLYTSGEHIDWPDSLNPSTGIFTYYGDNREPGHELHDTPRKGNQILRLLFERSSEGESSRSKIPPIFLFSKAGSGRNVIFRGLAVPGTTLDKAEEDLVAIWRSSGNRRFQNYKSRFTILDESRISRKWIVDVKAGRALSDECPDSWRDWVKSGIPKALISERVDIRSKEEQLPETPQGLEIIEAVHHYFNVEIQTPTSFEQCAVDLWRTFAPSTGEVDITRPWRDGGRDAIGNYLLGPSADPLKVDFALEAKCYGIEKAVGVKDISRLISRLRYRQFGVFVTTSFFGVQAYKEVREDRHPVVIMTARDCVTAISTHGITNGRDTARWLEQRY